MIHSNGEERHLPNKLYRYITGNIELKKRKSKEKFWSVFAPLDIIDNIFIEDGKQSKKNKWSVDIERNWFIKY